MDTIRGIRLIISIGSVWAPEERKAVDLELDREFLFLFRVIYSGVDNVPDYSKGRKKLNGADTMPLGFRTTIVAVEPSAIFFPPFLQRRKPVGSTSSFTVATSLPLMSTTAPIAKLLPSTKSFFPFMLAPVIA